MERSVKDSRALADQQDRRGKATVQQTTRIFGMAPITGDDRREHSLVGGVTVGAEP